MIHIALAGTKGGVGTTATACSLAAFLSDYRPVHIDGLSPDQIGAYMGISSTPEDGTELGRGLWYWTESDPDGDGVHISDCGTFADVLASGSASPWWRAQFCLAVTERSYAAVRAGIREDTLLRSASFVLVVSDPHRSLSPRDVHSALERPIIQIPFGPAIQRNHDAGLITIRQPDTMRRTMQHLTQQLGFMGEMHEGAHA